jgi:hypothetical protein
MVREEYLISQDKETELTLLLSAELLLNGFNSSNTVIITVSTDYSSTIGQLLRHLLSINGEICDGFGIDVPYPDQSWDEVFVLELEKLFQLYAYKLIGKKVLFVEAGVIRGGNYKFLSGFLEEFLGIVDDVYFLSLFENKHSVFKSDFVGEYYDNDTQDLTFWWERQNNHWK